MAKEVISVRIEQDIIERSREEAKNDNRPIGNYIETILKRELDSGYSQEIAKRISETRLLLNNVGLILPEDNDILIAFEKLAFFSINKFPIPKSHIDYINKSLKVDAGNSNAKMIEALKIKHKGLSEYFGIEIPLRGIESIFSWGNPEIELHDYIKLTYLIANLYSLIGDKAKIMEE